MGVKFFLNNDKGFTFMEILVVVGLISFTIVSILSVYTNIISTSSRVSQRSTALDLAQNVADDFTYLYRQNSPDINSAIDYWNDGNWKSDYDFDNSNDYEIEVIQKNNSDGFILIEINVSWQAKNKESQVQLETLIEDN
jgi:type II secretory pathway pseudopilin PulG